MGTTKRERQKANRQQRLEELAREARKDKTKKRGLLISGVVIGGLALLFLVAQIWSGDDPATIPTAVPLSSAVDATAAPDTTTDATTDTTTDASTVVDSTTSEAPTTTVAEPFAYGTAACAEADGSGGPPESFEGAPQLCIDPEATYSADVVTDKGSFTISLNTAGAPGNVNNFVTLARWGYYDGSTCHRVIKDFVVQCGRPDLDDEQAAEESPGYSVADELPSEGEYAAGIVAIANTGSPDTGGGQFFVITGANGASLPAQYTVLGTVTKGLDTTVRALGNLADPLADNGVPPLVPISITSVRITES